MVDGDSPVTLRTRKCKYRADVFLDELAPQAPGATDVAVTLRLTRSQSSATRCLDASSSSCTLLSSSISPATSIDNKSKPPFVLTQVSDSDILHPGRANISRDDLREKLGALYKATKDQISVFGLRTQFGGGKTTGFALVYDSPEAMKKFEPLYRLVRVGLGTKPERASRQQRTFLGALQWTVRHLRGSD